MSHCDQPFDDATRNAVPKQFACSAACNNNRASIDRLLHTILPFQHFLFDEMADEGETKDVDMADATEDDVRLKLQLG
jgi:hypothetical protein